jgi:hypothetical protein
MNRNKLAFFARVLFSLILITASMQASVYADYSTDLVFNGYIQDSSGDIDVGTYSVPVVYDWNSDGKKDLLVGQKYVDASGVIHGYVSYYENQGTNSSPSFNSSSYIQACSDTCILNVAADG